MEQACSDWQTLLCPLPPWYCQLLEGALLPLTIFNSWLSLSFGGFLSRKDRILPPLLDLKPHLSVSSYPDLGYLTTGTSYNFIDSFEKWPHAQWLVSSQPGDPSCDSVSKIVKDLCGTARIKGLKYLLKRKGSTALDLQMNCKICCCCSVIKFCQTLHDLMDCNTPGSPSLPFWVWKFLNSLKW